MSFTRGDDTLRSALQGAVGGRYEIIRLLGRGGMGAVYLARDTLERLVAVKVILPQAFAVGSTRERFRREMRTVARFAHPNIVPIYASGELEELDYFVMMYVSGDTIAERLRQEGRFPPEEARRILVELADALHYAHGFSVVHRDIKPANVLIDDMSGRAFLTDFGVAKTLSEAPSQSAATMAGTLGYMPPEAFSGGCVDHRADIYSLGVLAYEMMAGRRPFIGDNAIQIMVQTVNAAPPPLSALAPDVPPNLEERVMSCLAKDPAQRPRDARRLRSALGVKEHEEETMPQDLRDMAGFGSWTVLWVAVWATFGARAFDAPALGIALFSIALLVPAGFMLQVAGMRPAGLPILQIARVAFWPPKWWGMWWPRRLRRPTDLWRHLPLRPRLSRIALSAFLVIVPLLVLLATENDRAVSARASLLPNLAVAIGLLAAVVAAILVDGWLWARRADLDPREAIRMLIGPTIVSRLWDLPSMSALLAHHHHLAKPRIDVEPAYPRGCMSTIKEVAQRLTGLSRSSGQRALAAARELCSEIDALDGEISRLTDSSEPDARARLEHALGALPDGEGDDSSGARRRRPLVKELERLRAIESRVEAATRERASLFETQRAIWRELLALSRLDPNAEAADDLRGRIARLCDGLEDSAPADRAVRAVSPDAQPGVPVRPDARGSANARGPR